MEDITLSFADELVPDSLLGPSNPTSSLSYMYQLQKIKDSLGRDPNAPSAKLVREETKYLDLAMAIITIESNEPWAVIIKERFSGIEGAVRLAHIIKDISRKSHAAAIAGAAYEAVKRNKNYGHLVEALGKSSVFSSSPAPATTTTTATI